MSVTEATRTQGQADTAPPSLSMGTVVLTVNDLDTVGDFYARSVGLHRLDHDGEVVRYGTPDAVLLELRRDADARRRSPREAGLFHTAFLLPERADLARWTQDAIENRTPVAGVSDHLVSEAIYLTDPEGNGVEIYTDRPAAEWPRKNGEIEMSTDPLDVASLLASAGEGKWQGFPTGAGIGHVHLQAGALAPAEAFYAGVLGLDITCHYPGATFYAADGYHHHIATNIWNSRGAEMRKFPSTGLTEVEILVDGARAEAIRSRAGVQQTDPGRLVLDDPWGTPIALTIR